MVALQQGSPLPSISLTGGLVVIGATGAASSPEYQLERAHLNFLLLFSRAHETRSKLLPGQPVKM